MSFSISKLLMAVQGAQRWALVVPVGTTKADLEDPKNYTELVSRLSLLDLKPYEFPRIDITDEEGNFFADVVVVSNHKQKVKCKVLNFVEVSGGKPKKKNKKPADKPEASVEALAVTVDDAPESDEIVFSNEEFNEAKDKSLPRYIEHRGKHCGALSTNQMVMC